MGKLTGLWLLLAALNVALTDDTVVYFTDGGQITIEPGPPADRITNLLWMFKGNLVAEWNEKLIPLTYYSTFKGRADLSTSTGRLVINNASKDDQGVYSVTINSKVQIRTYTTKLIKTVPKPQVVIKPLTCSLKSERCSVSCDADIVGAKPVTYSWKKGEGEWKESEKVIDITKTGDKLVETITCRIQNPVSMEESVPIKNMFYNPGPDPGAVAGGVVGSLVLIGVVVGAFVAWKKKIGPFKDRSTGSAEPTSGNGHPASDTNDASAKPPESIPFNANPPDPSSDV